MAAMMLLPFSLLSQDVIYRANGDSISCKITKVDSTKIYFDIEKDRSTINTFLGRDEISGYKFQQPVKKTSRLNHTKKHLFCLSVDPLGFVTMGPAVTGEFLLQLRNSRVGFGFCSGLRLTNLGVTSNILLSSGTMGFFSYSVPISLRIYPYSKFSTDGIFFGPHIEFGKTAFTDGDKNHTRAFGAEVGYKWTYRSGFTLELVDAIGMIQTKDEYESVIGIPYTDPHYEPEWENLAFVFYMISLKLGISF